MVQQVSKLVLGAWMALFGIASHAQEYPAKPVRIIVPFARGGPADIYARFLGQRLQEALGQPFVVDNRPGAGSIIGTDAVAKSAGRRLHAADDVQHAHSQRIADSEQAIPVDARFRAVAPVNYSDLVLVVHPSVPANNLAELLQLAKSKPKELNYASSGNGTPYHMAGELFKAMAGVDIVHVPYKGSAGARTDMLGGQVQMMFDAVPTMTDHIRSGKVKAFGTTGEKRSAVLPERSDGGGSRRARATRR